MENTDLIDKYLQGRCSEEELALLEELVSNDPLFAQELEIRQDIKAVAMHSDGENFKEQLQVFEPKKEKPKPLRRFWIGAAAALAGFMTTIFILNFGPTENERLFAENFEPYRNIVNPVVRGSDNLSEEDQAFQAYEQQDYQRAVQLFQTLRQTNEEDYILLYLGNSYLALDNTDKAIEYFKLIETDSLLPQTQWYLALAYLKADNKADAIHHLAVLKYSQDFKAEESAEILEKISD